METVSATKLGQERPADVIGRVLCYGPAGTHKTWLLRTFPKPLLIHDFDQKLDSVMGVEGIEIVSYKVDDPQKASKEFRKFEDNWKETRKDAKWRTIAVDGITMMDILSIRHFNIMAGKAGDAKATLPVYGDQSDWYNWFFKYQVTDIINRNVYFTAHEHFFEDEEAGIRAIYPLITGKKILPKLPAMFTEVWYMERTGGQDGDIVLHYRTFKKAVANTLALDGDGTIKNPTFEKIMAQRRKS